GDRGHRPDGGPGATVRARILRCQHSRALSHHLTSPTMMQCSTAARIEIPNTTIVRTTHSSLSSV
ncbi:hypothetical protein, partial [Methylobacterium sp. CCH5-D2]|uniref:hypothetical protein n=1 Tax=Methylobacterium sp. CCH5-D2 TaxID=1768765 RepID=UPI001AEC8AA2